MTLSKIYTGKIFDFCICIKARHINYNFVSNQNQAAKFLLYLFDCRIIAGDRNLLYLQRGRIITASFSYKTDSIELSRTCNAKRSPVHTSSSLIIS